MKLKELTQRMGPNGVQMGSKDLS